MEASIGGSETKQKHGLSQGLYFYRQKNKIKY